MLNGSGKNDASRKISMNENNNNQTKIGILSIKYFIQHLLDLVYQTKSSCAIFIWLFLEGTCGCFSRVLSTTRRFCCTRLDFLTR